MKYLIVMVAALAAVTACGGKGAASAGEAAVAAAAPGTVVIAADSPMLKQLKLETASAKELPTDEVVAAGRIEANPNRVSKVVLPVAGRVTSVLVKTGDAVKKDQPLLTIQSSDADAAMSTFLSGQAAVSQARAALIKAQADFD